MGARLREGDVDVSAGDGTDDARPVVEVFAVDTAGTGAEGFVVV